MNQILEELNLDLQLQNQKKTRRNIQWNEKKISKVEMEFRELRAMDLIREL